MNKSSTKKNKPDLGPEPCFWESKLYSKSYFKGIKKRGFRYYDDTSILKYVFYHWVHKWAQHFTYENVEPYKLHPLILSDQVFKWQPIFSKHISDGLVRLDQYESSKSQSTTKTQKPYRSILLRALVLTLWKRTLLLIIGLIVVNFLSMSIAVLVKKLLEILNDKSFNFINTVLLLLSMLVCQIVDGLLVENINFYLNRIMNIIQYMLSLVTFNHSICHRRYFSHINGSNSLNVCNQVLHSCSPDSQCSKNPLFCPALRYQNHEISPKIFNIDWNDCFYVALFFQSMKHIIEFLIHFNYGVYLLSGHVKASLWILYVVGSLFFIFMFVIEIINSYIFKLIQYIRDSKVTKYNDIFVSLSNIKKMLCEDIAINIITQTRNDELSLIVVNMFLTFFNMTLYTSCINLSFYILQHFFVKSVNNASVVTDIDTAGFAASFYIFLKIINSMFLIPKSIKMCGVGYASFRRLSLYIKGCAPNFYISDNKYTGSTKTSSEITDTTNQIPNDVIVYYKDASFTWVNTRSDLLNKNYETYLKNINFELKRGEMAIVTGSKGSGKSNFIKSMLGEMTLVEGSMAVVPLHTSMPIFYASQDIFLQQGTIRSNITFGYKFDETIYNTVLKAVELEYDISTWEKGDLRVVSDNAPSLSGGQRVRMELARAVYAYLVFHKVNVEYNNSKCSFLMCLDGSFQGLDPYVSRTIFNNLFNVKTGLLAENDIAVVLTASKQSLEICSKISDITHVPNVPIYKINNQKLLFYSYLHNFIKHKKVDTSNYTYFKQTNTGPYHMNYLTNDMLSLCNSEVNTKLGRMEVTKLKYSTSFKSYSKDQLEGTKFNAYLVYMKPAALTFFLYILFTVALNVMDNVKLVLSTNLSDYITNNINDYKDGKPVDLPEIKLRAAYSLKITIIFVSIIIIFSFFSTIFISASCITTSCKLHEYALTSVFSNSSSVLKVKKHISQVITFFSCDIMMTDDGTGMILCFLLFSSIQTMINIVTLFYLIPISIPFILLTLVMTYFYVLKRYVSSMTRINFAYFEANYHMNSVLEDSITGSSVTRSFKRISDFLNGFTEHRDYKARCKFMLYYIISWGTITFNWILSVATLFVLVIPILLDRFTKYKMKVGYFGLALSLCMNAVRSVTNFSFVYACTEIFMVSVWRFQYFIPPGKKLVFDNFINTHEEHLVHPTNKDLKKLDNKQLLKRRATEFKNDNKKFYGLRKLFYHPKINILDAGHYLTPEHSGVELKLVCVYTTPDHNPDGMILKHITVSAHRSEIIGMVGRTGAGKTTLLSVLQNVIEHRTGQVLLDGKDLNDIPKVVLRQIIGVLPQLPFVFKGWTVRRFLDPRRLFTDDEINKALNQCGLLEFVNDLPGGKKLDTVLAPENLALSKHKSTPINYSKSNGYDRAGTSSELNGFGNNKDFSKLAYESDMLLSNSQLRTLSLARLVLYRDFYRIIVVDEPPEEDLAEEDSVRSDDLGVPIYDLLIKYFNHCTTFVTAHDPNVLKKCSSLWVIHDGLLIRTCKTSDVEVNESITRVIEQSVKYFK